MLTRGRAQQNLLDLTATLKQFKIGSDKPVICVRTTDNLAIAMKHMITNDTFFAPVINSMGIYVGVIDMFTLCNFTNWLHYQKPHPKKGTANYNLLISCWTRFSVGEKMEHIPALRAGHSMLSAMETLVSYRQRRMVIVTHDNKPCGVFSQSDVCDYLARSFAHDTGNTLASLVETKLDSLLEAKTIATIKQSQWAITAFSKLKRSKFSGLGIVNDNGVLTDVVTAKDLAGLTSNLSSFYRLWEPLVKFKAAIREEYPSLPPRPLTCLASTSLQQAVLMMQAAKVHRIFIVDAEGKPVNVFSQTDLLNIFVNTIRGGTTRVQ